VFCSRTEAGDRSTEPLFKVSVCIVSFDCGSRLHWLLHCCADVRAPKRSTATMKKLPIII
jgi:hypothetical protein